MKIAAGTLRDTIMRGIKKAARNRFLMTGEQGEQIHPEYLTTSSVCFAFVEHILANDLLDELVVRAEEQTKVLWRKAKLPRRIARSFKRKPKRALVRVRSEHLAKHARTIRCERWRETTRKDVSRRGNVDIAIFRKNGYEPLFAVIENKGFLSFTNDGLLYAESLKEVTKDLVRNAEFLATAGPLGGVEYTAFTFYLRDNESVLTGFADAFCRRMEVIFRSLATRIVNPTPHQLIDVHVETVDSNLFGSDKEARMPDENGIPAHEIEGTWHIACGIISIYTPSLVITPAGMGPRREMSLKLSARPPVSHTLKVWPDEFGAIRRGEKTHEVCKFDRNYQVGDTLLLREYNPETEAFSGEEVIVTATHITLPGTFGLPDDVGVMSIEKRKSP